MNVLSTEQKALAGAPLEPMSVIACAGSGKTRTAVHRLVEIRKRLADYRGRVVLLSFSNIAVDTFRSDYRALTRDLTGIRHSRVEIATMDSFITTNILRTHAYRTMGCDRTPFLIAGTEPFLKNKDFAFWAKPVKGEAFPVNPCDLGDIVVNIQGGSAVFQLRQHGALLPINNGLSAAEKLGAIGAYTHDLGRYWCYRMLTQKPGFLRVLARRYPQVLVDEAQDIGTLHQAILELLANAGSQVSLIGDPHQGIYEFAGADGKFLASYGQRPGVKRYGLTCNYRSVPAIVSLANDLADRADSADRESASTLHGAFFIAYKNTGQKRTIAAFCAAVTAAGLSVERSGVICRGRDQVNKLTGNDVTVGQGIVKGFALAANQRAKRHGYVDALRAVAGCVGSLLSDPPKAFVEIVTQPARYPEGKLLRRELWNFTRDPESGLPAATLLADTEWHPLLRERVEALLQRLHDKFGLTPGNTLGRRLANKNLPNAPLMVAADQADIIPSVRIDTVHQVKGESLDAVFYLAGKEHAEALLAGVDTELGRIGYVAVTRARNLFWLGIPDAALAELRPALSARGFQEVIRPL